MSLRWTLAVALVVTALVPLAAALAVPLFQAERRARADEVSRLGLARRQAAVLVERLEADLEGSAERALDDLVRVEADRRAVLRGPQAASRMVAEDLARRHGLDGLIVSAADGILAEALPPGVDGEALVAAHVAEGSPTIWGSPPVLVAAWEGALPPGERVQLLALRFVTDADVSAVAAITGAAVTLRDPSGVRVLGDAEPGVGPVSTVPFGAAPSGWTIRIEVPPADASRIRRDTLRTAAGIVPVAAVAALLVAALLAQRVSRPVRALAERADAVSRERAGAAFEVIEEPDEVRRLERAFERMLEGLEASEQRRVSAERIAAWQEVARRIAHEVKNPLSPIRVAVENLLRVRGRDPSALSHAVEEEGAAILEEVESLRRLVDEFSAFARLPLPSFAPCDPRKVARLAVERISERAARMEVAVHLDAADAPAEISADAEQLGRALRNVLENALDALEGAARKEIRVTVRRAGGRYGPMAEFEVMDSGEGLDAEARRRIFEPYFTTKGESGGTGLGMSIVYRIVAEHGGEAVADGSPGRGTVITLRVPERAASISG